MTIRTRLIGIQLLTALAVMLLGSGVFVWNEIRSFRESLVNDLASMAQLVGENSASALVFLDPDFAERVLATLAIEPHIAEACLYDADGDVFARFHRSASSGFVFPAAAATGEAFVDDHVHLFRPIVRDGEAIGTVFLRADLAELDARIVEFVRDAVLVLVLGTLLSIVLATLLQRRISEPVLDLVAATRTVSDTGDYTHRVRRHGDDELGALSAALNDMLGQIQRRDDSLQEARSTLEQRVEVRTRELSLAKEELETALAAALESRAAAEEARQAAEAANRTKSAFLANMSHEIRTPLNAVLGYAQILQGDGSLSDDQRRAIDTIDASGRHLLALINDILDISKIEAGRSDLSLVDFDLTELVQGLATMFEVRAAQKGLVFHLETEGLPSTPVVGDENKLRQVLINLLGNAVKFTGEGEVVLDVRAAGDERYAFRVSDTGPGIAPAQQQRIFEPFHQDVEGHSQGGTGLGLAISTGHIDMMGGALSLASEPGQGAEFRFELPLPAGDVESPAAAGIDWERVRRLAPGQRLRALVVDDVATNRDILQRLLEDLGVEVATAAGGREALARLRRELPDVLFLDIRMPDLDGMAVLETLIAERGREATRVVAVTASVFAHQQARYLEAGFHAFLDKPLQRHRVLACLHETLGVTFELEPEATGDSGTHGAVDIELGEVVLPGPILEGLRAAAATHSISDLRRRLDELEGLDDEASAFAAHLRQLCRGYDMKAVDEALSRARPA